MEDFNTWGDIPAPDETVSSDQATTDEASKPARRSNRPRRSRPKLKRAEVAAVLDAYQQVAAADDEVKAQAGRLWGVDGTDETLTASIVSGEVDGQVFTDITDLAALLASDGLLSVMVKVQGFKPARVKALGAALNEIADSRLPKQVSNNATDAARITAAISEISDETRDRVAALCELTSI